MWDLSCDEEKFSGAPFHVQEISYYQAGSATGAG